MKQQVNFSMFVDAFRSIRPDNFSYEGLEVLFDYFEQLEDDLEEELELDVIAICCDFEESSPQDLYCFYEIDVVGLDDPKAAVREFLEERTTIAGETNTGFVFYKF